VPRLARLLLLLALAGTLLPACSISPPAIVSVAPGVNAREVPSNVEIQIGFDRPMDHQSVESRFELKPALAGCPEKCRFGWNGNTLVFGHPHLNLQLSTTYSVTLLVGYADATGKTNPLQHSWRFTTEGPPTLNGVDPGDNASGVALERNIVLTFNRPMDAAALSGALSISPNLPFLLRFKPGGDGSQVALVPVNLLQPNTSYTISIERAADRHENLMYGRVQTRFQTGPAIISRKVGYLIGERGRRPFGVAMVDPHSDTFLGKPTPKILYSVPDRERATDGIVAFDWAPDGQRLAVIQASLDADEGRLQIINLSTGTTSRLPVSGSGLAWAPDGSTIVYLTRGNLHGYRVDTQQDITLSDGGTARGPIAFSPDSKSVAYSAVDDAAALRLRLLNLELRSRYRPIGLDDPADHPAWSLDGLKLAFRRLTAGGPELWIYDLSASGSAAYRRTAALDPSSLAWLNDNSTLIAAVGSGPAGSLYRVNIFSSSEAGGITRLTGSKEAPNGSSPSAPSYDRRISFVAVINELPQIFVMNGDGTRPQQLTDWEADFPYTGEAPNWSPERP
jgi:Tol biopolymer transport system component